MKPKAETRKAETVYDPVTGVDLFVIKDDIPQEERRVTYPPDVWKGIIDYTNAERIRNKDNSVLVQMMTPMSMAQHLVQNELQKRKYYPRDKKKQKSR
jgi:hypothetical protein